MTTDYNGEDRRRADDALSRLVSIETKIDAFVKSQGDHETRIRTLEKGWWKASGAAAVIGAATVWLGKHWGN